MTQILRDLVTAFPGRRVLVLGDLILDEYLWGQVQRISPEAPVPVVTVRRRSSAAGGAANAAVNVASLDGAALLAGVIGDDASGRRLRETLIRQGIQVDGLFVDSERATTTKTRVIAHQQHVVRVDEEESHALATGIEDQLLTWAQAHLAEAHACILSDYGKGVVSPRLAERFIALARKEGKPVIVDPKGIDYVKYQGATLVKPNYHEALAACRSQGAGDLLEVGRCLLDQLKDSALLVTRGAEGMTLFEKDRTPYSIPSVAREIFDVTGAGDTVASTLALALATGANLQQAAFLANQAAGIVVGKVGTAQATRAELMDNLGRGSN